MDLCGSAWCTRRRYPHGGGSVGNNHCVRFSSNVKHWYIRTFEEPFLPEIPFQCYRLRRYLEVSHGAGVSEFSGNVDTGLSRVAVGGPERADVRCSVMTGGNKDGRCVLVLDVAAPPCVCGCRGGGCPGAPAPSGHPPALPPFFEGIAGRRVGMAQSRTAGGARPAPPR